MPVNAVEDIERPLKSSKIELVSERGGGVQVLPTSDRKIERIVDNASQRFHTFFTVQALLDPELCQNVRNWRILRGLQFRGRGIMRDKNERIVSKRRLLSILRVLRNRFSIIG